MCLSRVSVGPPATDRDSTEAEGGGVAAALTPPPWLSWSNVSLLKKTNAETRGPANILRGFQRAPRVTSRK